MTEHRGAPLPSGEQGDFPPLTFWRAFGLLVGGAICVPLVVLGIFFVCEVLL